MLKLSIECARFERNYSSCTSGSSENICSTSGGTQEKRKPGETQKTINLNLWFYEFHPVFHPNVLFCRLFFESHPVYDETQGTGAVFS